MWQGKRKLDFSPPLPTKLANYQARMDKRLNNIGL
jgi:hypothetical protein